MEISFAYSCTKIAVLNFLKKLWKGNCGTVLLSDTEAFIPERRTTTKQFAPKGLAKNGLYRRGLTT